MALALLPLLLAAGASEPAAAQPSGIHVVALARVEIVAPVTNDLRGGEQTLARVINTTRDGRHFVEFQ